MKVKSKFRIVAGIFLIACSLWGFKNWSPRFLAPAILGVYFTFDGVFDIISLVMNRSYQKNRKIPEPLKRSSLSMEEKYYYKGKTNQQLHQYREALECYNKTLELDPDFEPAKEAKKEVEKVIK